MKPKHICIAIFFILFVTGSSFAGQWNTYTKNTSGLAGDTVRAICIDVNGVKWFGTADGLTRFDGADWTTYTTADSLAHDSVRDIDFEVTSHGPEIWVGTEGGVSVISVVPDAITFATPYRKDNTGLIDNGVNAAAVDSSHVKWFGTDFGVSSFNGGEWAQYDINSLLTGNRVLSIAVDLDGWIYFGTDGAGITRFDGVTSASPWDTDWTGLPSDAITAAYVAPDGIPGFAADRRLQRHIGPRNNPNP
ncbi:MAG: hypothetical protein J7M24_07650, partial [Candidatus Latescibacteria bacterium]|nr:hypothetical protein [Candidatus Latescibacterota bacterium]